MAPVAGILGQGSRVQALGSRVRGDRLSGSSVRVHGPRNRVLGFWIRL